MSTFIKVNGKPLNIRHIIKIEPRPDSALIYLTGSIIETVQSNEIEGFNKLIDEMTLKLNAIPKRSL